MVAFGPKILGGGRDLQFVILFEKESSFSDADNVKWCGGDTQTLLDGKKIKLYILAGGGDAKSFRFSLAPKD